MPQFRYPKIFVSATSRGLKPLRLEVTKHLEEKKNQVVVQEEFAGTYQTIKDMIRDEIASCDAVILLVGPAYGFEPTEWPEGLPRCSYTQLEYELAVELGIPVYRYMVSDKYLLAPFDLEPLEHQQRQQKYIARLKAQDNIWYEFDTSEQLLAMLDKTRFHNRVTPNLPFSSIGKLFKGRGPELEAVRKSLLTRPAHATAVTSKQAIHGLGGVGKTRFAIEYAHRYGTEYSAQLYANADSASALASNMALLVHVLNLPEQEEREQSKQLEAVERWLRMHAGWLLILDNVDTVEAQAAVNSFFPKLANGHVLVTSRLTSGWADGVNAVELDTLSIPASTEFLMERTDRDPTTPTRPARQLKDSDPQDAQSLATYLGGLALALEQAGAYICQHAITLADYQVRLKAVESNVLEWYDADVMQYPKSVAVTWQASVNELYDDGRALLNMLCWLAPDPIPVGLIRTEPIKSPNVPIKSREKALRQLQDYSLAKGNATGDAVTVHRLVQNVTRVRLGTHLQTLEDSIILTHSYSQPDGRQLEEVSYRNLWSNALPHIEWLCSGIQSVAPTQLTMMMNNIAMFYAHIFRQDIALHWIDRAKTLAGTDAEFNWMAENNTAEVYRQNGDYIAAERIFTELIERMMEADDPPLLWFAKTVSNLGIVYMETSRFSEAKESFRVAIEAMRRTPDANLGELAKMISNMGCALIRLGETKEAEEHFEISLSIEEQFFGPDSPAVARSLNNLAFVISQNGHSDETESYHRRSLDISLNWYGPDHPIVAQFQLNLAELLRETSRENDAELLYVAARQTVEQTLGTRHLLFANVLNGLALVHESRGEFDLARDLFSQCLEILYRFFLVTGLTPPNWDAAKMNLLSLLLRRLQMAEQEAFEFIGTILTEAAMEMNTQQDFSGNAP